jgi:membrane protease YdiL (CAAX protease family)
MTHVPGATPAATVVDVETLPVYRSWLTDAAVGVVLTILLVLLVSTWITSAQAGLLLSYLAVWAPFAVLVLVAVYRHGTGSMVRDLGLRFRPIDVLWGLAIGMLARVVASLIEIAGYGRMGGGAVTFGETVHDGWWLFGAVLAPVLIAPFMEEVFFRGLVLRAVVGDVAGSQAVSLCIAIAVSGLVFALVHVLQATTATEVWVTGLGTLVFGLAAASVAAITGRLGGAIIAHVTFNAMVVVPALF